MSLDQSKSNVRDTSLFLESFFLKVSVVARSRNITIYNVIVNLLLLLSHWYLERSREWQVPERQAAFLL